MEQIIEHFTNFSLCRYILCFYIYINHVIELSLLKTLTYEKICVVHRIQHIVQYESIVQDFYIHILGSVVLIFIILSDLYFCVDLFTLLFLL